MKGLPICSRKTCVNNKTIDGVHFCKALRDREGYDDDYCPFFKDRQYAQEQKQRLEIRKNY